MLTRGSGVFAGTRHHLGGGAEADDVPGRNGGMAFMKRLSGVVQAKANKVLDRVEDPRETLDLSYEKQLEQLQQVRKGVADVATARKRIELQAQQLQQSATKPQDQARQALAQNREGLAREALTRRSALSTQLDQLKIQHDQLSDQEQKLIATNQ